MSGHSKWATIKHKKGAADKARAKVFNKIARQLEVAAREGGADATSNASLRTVIQKAKAAQMTNDAIDRAVKRGAGLGGDGAGTIAFIAVTLLTAYISLVLGELVPKRLAIQQSEALALAFAIPVEFIAKVTKPFIWLLTASTNLILRILGGDPGAGGEFHPCAGQHCHP